MENNYCCGCSGKYKANLYLIFVNSILFVVGLSIGSFVGEITQNLAFLSFIVASP